MRVGLKLKTVDFQRFPQLLALSQGIWRVWQITSGFKALLREGFTFPVLPGSSTNVNFYKLEKQKNIATTPRSLRNKLPQFGNAELGPRAPKDNSAVEYGRFWGLWGSVLNFKCYHTHSLAVGQDIHLQSMLLKHPASQIRIGKRTPKNNMRSNSKTICLTWQIANLKEIPWSLTRSGYLMSQYVSPQGNNHSLTCRFFHVCCCFSIVWDFCHAPPETHALLYSIQGRLQSSASALVVWSKIWQINPNLWARFSSWHLLYGGSLGKNIFIEHAMGWKSNRQGFGKLVRL